MKRKSDPENGKDIFALKRHKIDDVGTTDYPECSTSHTTVNDLPPEILMDIFSSFSIGELCLTISPVCKHWYVLSRHPSLWKHLSFKGERVTTERLCLLLSNATELHSLEIICRLDATAVLEQVAISNLRLQKLIVRRCVGSPQQTRIDEDILIKLVKRCSKLVEIITKESDFCGETFFEITGQVLPNLNRIHFHYHLQFGTVSLNGIACNCRDLEEVCVYWLSLQETGFFKHYVPESDMHELCTRMKDSLQILKFSTWNLTVNAMKSIVQCTCLHTLRLNFSEFTSDEGLLQLITSHNLSTLEFLFADGVSPEGWHQLFNSCNWASLRNLSLDDCEEVDNTVLESIGRNCLNLQSISLSNCFDVSKEGAAKLIKGCKQLIFLGLNHTQVSVVQSFPLIPTYTPNLKCLLCHYSDMAILDPMLIDIRRILCDL